MISSKPLKPRSWRPCLLTHDNTCIYHYDTFFHCFCEGAIFEIGETPLRCAIATWWLLCLILTTIYSANLVAFLAVVKTSVPFRTLDDLSRQTQYKIGTLGESVWSQLLAVSFVRNLNRERSRS